MADGTHIEWTATQNPDGSVTPGATWNPIVGCSPVSPGCASCYAVRSTHRVAECQGDSPTGRKYAELTVVQGNGRRGWTGRVAFFEDRLLQPLRWTRPRKVFVNSQSDLFHEDLDETAIDRIFATMALAKDHTFQVLTKRPERMLEYMRWEGEWSNRAGRVRNQVDFLMHSNPAVMKKVGKMARLFEWPLKNVWLGTSVEDQACADERIPHLLRTPSAVRWLSCEPLVGPVDLSKWLHPGRCPIRHPETGLRCGLPGGHELWHEHTAASLASAPWFGQGELHWVVTGGESGPNSRPAHPDWFRTIRDQCAGAGVPFFFKQWGNWAVAEVVPGGDLGGEMRAGRVRLVCRSRKNDGHRREGDVFMRNTGKKLAGALLDGVAHRQFPAPPGS